jgi:rRNA maturation endonuclease Nob1
MTIYYLKAQDCSECQDLHPETVIAWQDFTPEESDTRPWSIVSTIEEIKQVYVESASIIESEKELARLAAEKQKIEETKTEEIKVEEPSQEELEKIALFENVSISHKQLTKERIFSTTLKEQINEYFYRVSFFFTCYNLWSVRNQMRIDQCP